MSARTTPQGLVEQLQHRQDGGWVRQLSLKPAVQLKKRYCHLLGAFTHLLYLLYLQFSLCDSSMYTFLYMRRVFKMCIIVQNLFNSMLNLACSYFNKSVLQVYKLEKLYLFSSWFKIHPEALVHNSCKCSRWP